MPSSFSKKSATAEEKSTEVKDFDGAVRAAASKSAQAAINVKLTAEQKIEFYRTMVRTRRFEERCLRSYQQGKIGGFLHLYIGQEAVAVGCCSVMQENDQVITAYRDHGHAIAVGMPLNPLMAELYG